MSKINPRFGINRKLSITPVNFDEGYVVEGKDGNVLFSVMADLFTLRMGNNATLKWLSILFALITLYSISSEKRVLPFWGFL